MNAKAQLSITIPRTKDMPATPDTLQEDLQEYLNKWWLAAMPGVVVRVDGVSAEVEE